MFGLRGVVIASLAAAALLQGCSLFEKKKAPVAGAADGGSQVDGGAPIADAGPELDAGGVPDAGVFSDGGRPTDAGMIVGGFDAGPSVCGQPGDMGNSLGVGHFCNTSSDCPSTAPVCSTLEWQVLMDPDVPSTDFCLIQGCDPCGDVASQCGSSAICACYIPQDCVCAPASCSDVPWSNLDGGTTCLPDAGSP